MIAALRCWVSWRRHRLADRIRRLLAIESPSEWLLSEWTDSDPYS